MVLFKNQNIAPQPDEQAFDALLHPGQTAPYSGIYRCEACGHEVAASRGELLPGSDHHRHSLAQGPIRWRLIVRTIHKNKDLASTQERSPLRVQQ